jgi:hypothetical protein
MGNETGDQINPKAAREEPPHYHGHREHLRERFRQAGAGALSDYELLEMVLFRVIPRGDVKPLAKILIKTFGSFAQAIPRDAPARNQGRWRCDRHRVQADRRGRATDRQRRASAARAAILME